MWWPSTVIARTVPLIPPPTELQLVPSHFAKNEMGALPAMVKLPPAYSSPVSATPRPKITVLHENPVHPLIPLPSASQFVPVHRAMLLATPVGVVKAKLPAT